MTWPGLVIPSMGQIEISNDLSVSKQMTNMKLNCYYYIAILETISQCANKWALDCLKKVFLHETFKFFSNYFEVLRLWKKFILPRMSEIFATKMLFIQQKI